MGKQMIDGILARGEKAKDKNGNRLVKKVLSHGTYRCQRHPHKCVPNTFTKKTLTNRVLKGMSKKELLNVEAVNRIKVNKFLAKLAGQSLQDKYARDVAINNLEERIDAFGV
jgi:hypothetical protein